MVQKFEGLFKRIDARLDARRRAQGVAIYFVRAVVASLVAAAVWYLGNIVLYGDVGVVEMTSQMDNAATNYFPNTHSGVRWMWNILPWIFMLGASLYAIFGAIRGGR